MQNLFHNLIISCALLFFTSQVYAQQQDAFLLDNVSASGVQQMFFKSTVLKSGSYTYTCGATINDSGNYDMLLSAFDALADTLLWSVSYDGSYHGDDYASDIVVDGYGNIIISGTMQVGSLDYDAIIIKYNSSGVQQWV